MDITTIIGLILGLGGVVMGYLEEGHFDLSLLGGLWGPGPFLIVFVGGFGATLVGFPLSEFKKMLSTLSMLFTQKNYNEIDIINELADLSEKARKDGLLSLEQDAQTNKNDLIRKGLALVVDGIETEVIKDILARETELQGEIYESGAKIFEAMGGTWPAMGVCGTVMGMLSILKDLSDPLALGPKIAGAFIATMYGVAFANLLWLPFGNKIKVKAARETMINELIIEGLLSIQAGENPRIIKEKLNLNLMEKLNGKKEKEDAAIAEEGVEA
ncbi:motility protein A [Ruminiclostridium cellobioparum]|jgi:chemotaxis protein MotA|uniref:Flagellar motor component n=1 Tax=Ruminiclostridium cellobioparum subsp. termitidis CT1112 TaxID=1195236 RepID=S0FSD4_RUMCE|nr:MotA/TolQ/ExbB proton channel family protein [Ruminiclostridium cellobioparum]EMS72099.1 Flagellar motor component [Ruminiclostridium cellobioparum subsp. termitidis CT1112]